MSALTDFLPVAVGAATGNPALAAAGMAPQVTGASAAMPTPMSFNPTSPINVAPVGVNLGEILKGYEQGSASNGGSGARIPSRYTLRGDNQALDVLPASSSAPKSASPGVIVGVSVAAMGLAWYIFRKRS